MKTYNVRATQWEHGWELDIDGVGVTQSHGLGDAEMMVRDYIALDLGVPSDSFGVDIAPDFTGAPALERIWHDPDLSGELKRAFVDLAVKMRQRQEKQSA